MELQFLVQNAFRNQEFNTFTEWTFLSNFFELFVSCSKLLFVLRFNNDNPV